MHNNFWNNRFWPHNFWPEYYWPWAYLATITAQIASHAQLLCTIVSNAYIEAVVTCASTIKGDLNISASVDGQLVGSSKYLTTIVTDKQNVQGTVAASSVFKTLVTANRFFSGDLVVSSAFKCIYTANALYSASIISTSQIGRT